MDTVTAVSLVAELYNFQRFRYARQLMSYLGLVPGECSGGDRERRGSITKTGNGHARRLLIEAAGHQRSRPAIGQPLGERRAGEPAWVLAIADWAMERLWRRWTRRRSALPSSSTSTLHARKAKSPPSREAASETPWHGRSTSAASSTSGSSKRM
jgi:hypothetical protein